MSEGADAALVWCPFPDRDTARSAAAQLLDERLIACANLIGGIESHFVWQGERGMAEEVGLLSKTTAALLPTVLERLGGLHPYGVPAIVGWHCDRAHPATLDWLATALPSRPAM